MVVVSFDDPVNGRTVEALERLFGGKYRNPNGCPIKGTFFVSHEWNDYDKVEWLTNVGHEVAVNSIT